MSEGCIAVKRFGESCPKNNNCTYPQCLIDEHTEAWKGVADGKQTVINQLKEEKKALQKRVHELEAKAIVFDKIANQKNNDSFKDYLLKHGKLEPNEHGHNVLTDIFFLDFDASGWVKQLLKQEK